MPRTQFSLKTLLWLTLVVALPLVGCTAKPIEKARQPPAEGERLDGPLIRVYLLDGQYYEKRAVETGDDGPIAPPDKSFRTWPILRSKDIATQKLAGSIREAVSDSANFGGGGSDCFNPGMGISFGEGDRQIDTVVCIDCEWLYLYEPGKKVEQKTLSAAGKRKFARLYAEIFPEESKSRQRK